MLVCGEPSGDQLGGELMAGLKALEPSVVITGVGGAAMAAQGLKTLFPLDDTAVMGLREVVPKIPVILRRVREAADYALADAARCRGADRQPGFHPSHRPAPQAHRSGDPHRELCRAAGLGLALLSRQGDGALFRSGAGAVAVRSAVLRILWPQDGVCRPSGDRARRADDGRRGVARAARHRGRCAAAVRAAGQPHQ